MNLHHYTTEWQNDCERLKNYLKSVDSQFHEPLSNRVDIEEYAQKLSEKASNIWIMAAMEPVGHIAFYENKSCGSLFVTSISVKKSHQRRHLGYSLIQEAINYAKDKAFQFIELEVDARSTQATAFYEKLEFVESKKSRHTNPNIKTLRLEIVD